MALNPARVGSSAPLRSLSKDRDRPNLVFSSDIPAKVAQCVAELHLFQGGTKTRLVDLSRSIRTFDVILELNALLLRNAQLTPSELVRRNLIFVAKSKHSQTSTAALPSFHGFSDVWRSVLSMKKASEVFVVSLRLTVHRFSIDLANVDNFTLAFANDQDYQSLLLCGDSVVHTLTAYIRRKLLLEIKHNTDISVDITRPSTILQDSPIAEPSAQIEDVCNPGSIGVDNIGLFDTTLDGNDTSQLIGKQLVFVDDPDFSSSDDELRVLLSDDSGKCTANEDDEFDTLASEAVSPDMLVNLLGSESYHSAGTLTANEPASNASDTELHEHESFIKEVHNMRHNDVVPTRNGETAPALGPSPHLLSGRPSPPLPLQRPTPLLPFKKTTPHLPLENPSFEDIPESPEPSYFDDRPEPAKNSDGSFRIKKHPSDALLRKKSSFAFISHDDNEDLQYAFRDNSSTVPQFIKLDKKFKFIKVGKVQKFVNMFEEKTDSAPTSKVTSRLGTRPASPLKVSE